ncbi:DUF4256 domain-containing protein [Polluticaenibacter yanchengensis]|uniref:DUF4256 domain-containing protein n=1 Tax=Polluticaenibacter yanchengensis TaxID=3014562 RepID=A0ABT4UHK5_9BACT|nr:DUF4256 domain-containing protein [Chitinophagaceae bacterium LY-5]
MSKPNKLPAERSEELLEILRKRFEKNMNRHEGISWVDVQAKLEKAVSKLYSINEMEETGGEPDVIGYDTKTNEYIFCDCSAETPKGRRSLCYDDEALASRKEHKPKNSAINLAKEIGINLLTEDEYFQLQQLGSFDNKTSSWLKTPESVRKQGGAIFGDKRFGRVFIYHNGAESYYGVRGFRGLLRV